MRTTPPKKKRKYNASHRLRLKVGEAVFPARSKIIYSNKLEEMMAIPEAKILMKEYGFILKPQLF